MHLLLLELRNQLEFTDDIFEDSIKLLSKYNKIIVAEHSKCVAIEAGQLANVFGENCEDARLAGVLHDISAVIPNDKKIEVAESLYIDILSEEKQFPPIIHQKLSKEIARIVFGITNERILNAIGCHTTLKDNPTPLEMIVFIADKLKWDQEGIPPYFINVQEGLKQSLENGVFAFVKYLYHNQSSLKVVHPWLVDAYDYLREFICEQRAESYENVDILIK